MPIVVDVMVGNRTKPSKYPYLAVSRNNPTFIVAFNQRNRGVIVASATASEKFAVGVFDEDADFEPFDGTITLANA